jgi:predicted metal-dependent phosphoesterase TrpH
MCVDLHTHSIYSDGTNTPTELVTMAAANNLKGFALTDHDTTEGVAEALRAGEQHGLEVITGLEISAVHRKFSLHILGYGIDPQHPDLLHWLDRVQQGRITRNAKILAKLGGMGIDISQDELERLSSRGQAGRPHIARLLVDKGIVPTMGQAFSHYLGRNKPAWQSRFAYTAAESIAIIHRAGGLAVLAHPGQLDPGMKIQSRIIAELAERGLDGLEIHYPSHGRKMVRRLEGLARKYNLIATGGSDFHGSNRAGELAGGSGAICPPDSIMDNIHQRLRQPHPETVTTN